ncbi:MAG TPA: hypothetical protein VIQ02_20400 [Jiangellaceae bacterium]
MPVRRVYARCNGGHYFRGSVCPFDGWSVEGLDAVQLAELRLLDAQENLSVEALRVEGIADQVAARLLIIEFPSPEAVFDAIEPQGLVVNGEYVHVDKLGPELR